MNLSILDLEKSLWDAVQEQIDENGRKAVLTLGGLEALFMRAILGKQLRGPADGYPKALTRKYRDDNLLSMSDRMRGAVGYGTAERVVNNEAEEAAAIAEGFGGSLKSAHYPLTLKLSAIPGGAPAQEIIVRSPQEELDALIGAEQDGRKVTVLAEK